MARVDDRSGLDQVLAVGVGRAGVVWNLAAGIAFKVGCAIGGSALEVLTTRYKRERGEVQRIDELSEVLLQQLKAILVCVDAVALDSLIKRKASPIRSSLDDLKSIQSASTERVEKQEPRVLANLEVQELLSRQVD